MFDKDLKIPLLPTNSPAIHCKLIDRMTYLLWLVLVRLLNLLPHWPACSLESWTNRERCSLLSCYVNVLVFQNDLKQFKTLIWNVISVVSSIYWEIYVCIYIARSTISTFRLFLRQIQTHNNKCSFLQSLTLFG